MEHRVVSIDNRASKQLDSVREALEEHEADGWELSATVEIKGTTQGIVLVRES